jgi:hypothetical protein
LIGSLTRKIIFVYLTFLTYFFSFFPFIQTTTKKKLTMAGQTEWPANKVRSTFNKYFEDNGHVFVPSSSTIPHDDPTLLFANAGMNQVKKVFFSGRS